ncbi:MAG: 3-isopropylmalate dehydrogenase [Candidatus Jacksonbacteria bacterium RIFOXYC2_FULL_44_29]|nr:MAG: 3-isopropylmalate dehydrogenase [Parcubacteria group bacterium GW2011_GWA2_42_28]KKT55137.1 MAG: 3-isopropylmalate dehydrogenase [Parcubacteria group bacterium GW2011_GWC2_44_22]OGY75522.1 MAG: 3-isopropylmalate dehydrogenase [Candidatus Jacksonbacteria bacterium RIFOXYA2_FULL_43_12]OGY75816.1 MAG: 3-isopropylmalate dehydrogenase [Candidatus Jacksonbacteria bacterium RIFOXYB2_FULL_44_15]OGY77876.1 MAG: 3-isopropylmalate dehydrogenase [Candidatus Jacksonbacteria bacterium RIFOXYC2_FULL_4
MKTAENQKTYQIAVIGGDGIGPEITVEAVKVLEAVAKRLSCQFIFKHLLAGGEAWDKFGKHLPEETVAVCQQSQAILFGAVGGPVEEATKEKWAGVERNVILGLRSEFDLFANIRPIKGEGADFVIVRELTSDIYFGNVKARHLIKFDELSSEETVDVMYYNTSEIERILEVAFKLAGTRKRQVTLVDKANVLETSKLWRRVAERLVMKYPDIQLKYMFVDNAAYQIAKNPDQFDVLVTGNMFGDILSDEAAVWAKSLGMIPSGSWGGSSFGMYEPAHGSAPKHTGLGTANPLATILSAAMLLRHSLKLLDGAFMIEQAVEKVLQQGYGTPDLQPEKVVTTKEIGDLVVKQIIPKGIN